MIARELSVFAILILIVLLVPVIHYGLSGILHVQSIDVEYTDIGFLSRSLRSSLYRDTGLGLRTLFIGDVDFHFLFSVLMVKNKLVLLGYRVNEYSLPEEYGVYRRKFFIGADLLFIELDPDKNLEILNIVSLNYTNYSGIPRVLDYDQVVDGNGYIYVCMVRGYTVCIDHRCIVKGYGLIIASLNSNGIPRWSIDIDIDVRRCFITYTRNYIAVFAKTKSGYIVYLVDPDYGDIVEEFNLEGIDGIKYVERCSENTVCIVSAKRVRDGHDVILTLIDITRRTTVWSIRVDYYRSDGILDIDVDDDHIYLFLYNESAPLRETRRYGYRGVAIIALDLNNGDLLYAYEVNYSVTPLHTDLVFLDRQSMYIGVGDIERCIWHNLHFLVVPRKSMGVGIVKKLSMIFPSMAMYIHGVYMDSYRDRLYIVSTLYLSTLYIVSLPSIKHFIEIDRPIFVDYSGIITILLKTSSVNSTSITPHIERITVNGIRLSTRPIDVYRVDVLIPRRVGTVNYYNTYRESVLQDIDVELIFNITGFRVDYARFLDNISKIVLLTDRKYIDVYIKLDNRLLQLQRISLAEILNESPDIFYYVLPRLAVSHSGRYIAIEHSEELKIVDLGLSKVVAETHTLLSGAIDWSSNDRYIVVYGWYMRSVDVFRFSDKGIEKLYRLDKKSIAKKTGLNVVDIVFVPKLVNDKIYGFGYYVVKSRLGFWHRKILKEFLFIVDLKTENITIIRSVSPIPPELTRMSLEKYEPYTSLSPSARYILVYGYSPVNGYHFTLYMLARDGILRLAPARLVVNMNCLFWLDDTHIATVIGRELLVYEIVGDTIIARYYSDLKSIGGIATSCSYDRNTSRLVVTTSNGVYMYRVELPHKTMRRTSSIWLDYTQRIEYIDTKPLSKAIDRIVNAVIEYHRIYIDTLSKILTKLEEYLEEYLEKLLKLR